MNRKLFLSVAAVVAGAVLFAAAIFAGEEMREGMVGLCAGIGGALLGLGISGVFQPLLMRALTPEQRKEAERSERDERSVLIRLRAAQSSWYWTLYLLWIPFVAAMVRGEIFWMVMCPAVIVVHCAIYMAHMYRWSRKM